MLDSFKKGSLKGEWSLSHLSQLTVADDYSKIHLWATVVEKTLSGVTNQTVTVMQPTSDGVGKCGIIKFWKRADGSWPACDCNIDSINILQISPIDGDGVFFFY